MSSPQVLSSVNPAVRESRPFRGLPKCAVRPTDVCTGRQPASGRTAASGARCHAHDMPATLRCKHASGERGVGCDSVCDGARATKVHDECGGSVPREPTARQLRLAGVLPTRTAVGTAVGACAHRPVDRPAAMLALHTCLEPFCTRAQLLVPPHTPAQMLVPASCRRRRRAASRRSAANTADRVPPRRRHRPAGGR